MKIQKKSLRKKNVLLIVLSFFVVTGLVLGWYFSHQSKPFIPAPTDEQKRSAAAQNDSTRKDRNTPSSSIGNSSKDAPKTSTSSPNSSIVPAKPEGTFVSNHRPNINGSPAPSTEVSVCHTTPGTQCVIEFSRDEITVSLPTQVVNMDGNTSWNWDIKQLGLTPGEWTITAKAINGSHTSITTDPMMLTVLP